MSTTPCGYGAARDMRLLQNCVGETTTMSYHGNIYNSRQGDRSLKSLTSTLNNVTFWNRLRPQVIEMYCVDVMSSNSRD